MHPPPASVPFARDRAGRTATPPGPRAPGRSAARAAALALSLALAAGAASAQVAATLYGGARSGGSFVDRNAGDVTVDLGGGAAAAFSLDWDLGDGRQAQLFVGSQRSALPGSVAGVPGTLAVRITHLHAGGRAFLGGTPAGGGLYAVGGLGLTQLSPGLAGLVDEWRPSMNVGLGWQWQPAPAVALRAELRGYITFVNSSGGFFCSGGCVVALRGDTLTQAEALVGLSVGF